MSKGKVELVTGDDVILIHEIEKTNQATGLLESFNIPNTATVKSRLISLDHETYYTDEITQSDSEDGADWSQSIIAVKFPSADTQGIVDIVGDLWKNGKINAQIETQIDDNGKNTYFASVVIVKGSIS